ncbi:hypothetical protein ACOMHN_056016 [Nucella lapillus]
MADAAAQSPHTNPPAGSSLSHPPRPSLLPAQTDPNLTVPGSQGHTHRITTTSSCRLVYTHSSFTPPRFYTGRTSKPAKNKLAAFSTGTQQQRQHMVTPTRSTYTHTQFQTVALRLSRLGSTLGPKEWVL